MQALFMTPAQGADLFATKEAVLVDCPKNDNIPRGEDEPASLYLGFSLIIELFLQRLHRFWNYAPYQIPVKCDCPTTTSFKEFFI